MTDLNFFLESLSDLAKGIPITIELSAISVAVGFCLAVLLTLGRRSRFAPLRWFVAAYVFVFRGTPLLVQIYLLYYGPGQFAAIRNSVAWTILREPYWCALISLSLITAAYGSEIIRGGLQSVPTGVVEAASALGLSGFQKYRLIVFPLALRNALPAYGNEIIMMVKGTSLASVITIMDVTGIAYRIIAESYQVSVVFVMAGLIYLALNFLVIGLVTALERKLNPE